MPRRGRCSTSAPSRWPTSLLCDAGQPYQSFPLGLAVCPGARMGSSRTSSIPNSLFRHYLYASGTSGTLASYFVWFAEALGRCVRPGARVLEIASNDGTHLSCLADQGFHVMGVDPAQNLNDIAAAAGHRVLTGFFPDTRPEGRFDVIIAMNVAAHTPQPLPFLAGVAEVLAPNGVAFIQTSQALMIANGEFDTVYHEHYSFYTVASMHALAARAGLRVEKRAARLDPRREPAVPAAARRRDRACYRNSRRAGRLRWRGPIRSPHSCRPTSAAARPTSPMPSSPPGREHRSRRRGTRGGPQGAGRQMALVGRGRQGAHVHPRRRHHA